MRAIGVFGAIVALMALGAAIGYVVAKQELKRKVRQEMEREGWSRRHMQIYHAAISALHKIVAAHNLDAPMEFRVVQIPDNLRSDAQNIIDRYREEIDA